MTSGFSGKFGPDNSADRSSCISHFVFYLPPQNAQSRRSTYSPQFLIQTALPDTQGWVMYDITYCETIEIFNLHIPHEACILDSTNSGTTYFSYSHHISYLNWFDLHIIYLVH